jgi:cell division protein FtsB
MFWRNLWARLQSLGFVVFLVIVGVGAALLFVPLWHKRHRMQAEIRRLDAETAHQEALEKQQKAEIEALKTDPSYLERTARGKLNLARPNETIFRFDAGTGTSSTVSTTAVPRTPR